MYIFPQRPSSLSQTMDTDLTYNITILLEPLGRHYLFPWNAPYPSPTEHPTMSDTSDVVRAGMEKMSQAKDNMMSNMPSTSNMGANSGNNRATTMPSDRSGPMRGLGGDKDPQPEDLPVDAGPGGDEEFGARAAWSHK
ncbi:hypothetical protein DL546_005105 [Coniochaeta pulveracea]|uniref:Uncharacterized protein n=1 Tax=Coniochaeta pulveracea TaxID=177199 RepID=A0A420Y5R8_9PEZI|nr:hypothetical protein DL546_005105 [Coniochaeta pulveracea]